MGDVWQARHASGAAVAVKIVPSAARVREAFSEEVRAVAGLDHPNVVTVLDHGVVEGSPWLAMELAEGSLVDHVPARWPGVRAVLLQLLDALAHAHARGIVHLDLKPGNVLRGGSRAPWVLSDFGIARALGQVPTDGEVVRTSAGTPG